MVARDRKIKREMMAFDAPAPGIGAGLAENSDKVEAGIASWRLGFEIEEDIFQAHDICRLDQSAHAQARRQQRVRKGALRSSHFFEGKSLAGLGDEIPVEALFIFEFIDRLGPLFGGERSEPFVGGVCHLARGQSGPGRNDSEVQTEEAACQSRFGDRGKAHDCKSNQSEAKGNRKKEDLVDSLAY